MNSYLSAFVICISLAAALKGHEAYARTKLQLHEYSSYTLPIELRHAITTSEYRILQSLQSGLLRYGPEGAIVSNLADRWHVNSGGWIDFHLSPAAKWSDGTPIIGSDVKSSLDYTQKIFQKASSKEFSSIASVEVLSDSMVRVYIAKGFTPPVVLSKLTRTMAGIVRFNKNKPSSKITSGPYTLLSESKNEIVLSVNRSWIRYSPEMFDEVHLRPLNSTLSPSTLSKDPWPDFLFLGQGALKSQISALPPQMPVWHQNRNRVMDLTFAGRSSPELSRILIGLLRSSADLNSIANEMEDAVVADEVYPAGSVLHANRIPKPSTIDRTQFLQKWKSRSVRIAYLEDKLDPVLKASIEAKLRRTIPVKLEFTGIKTMELEKVQLDRSFDLILSNTGVDPDDTDEDMAYLFETPPIQIPSSADSELTNFKARLNEARRQGNPIAGYRQILHDAVESNSYLPLVHFPGLAIGRETLDFSHVARNGDVLPYSAIRPRKGR